MLIFSGVREKVNEKEKEKEKEREDEAEKLHIHTDLEVQNKMQKIDKLISKDKKNIDR